MTGRPQHDGVHAARQCHAACMAPGLYCFEATPAPCFMMNLLFFAFRVSLMTPLSLYLL